MTRTNTRKLTVLALLSALIVALGIICSFVRFGPVSIMLALTPIIIGAALYGVGAGALLGFVFGLVTFVSGLIGWDGGFIMLLMTFGDNVWFAIATILLCFGKAVLAGGGRYRLHGAGKIAAVYGINVTPTKGGSKRLCLAKAERRKPKVGMAEEQLIQIAKALAVANDQEGGLHIGIPFGFCFRVLL